MNRSIHAKALAGTLLVGFSVAGPVSAQVLSGAVSPDPASQVSTTILPGSGLAPAAPAVVARAPRPGPVTLNLTRVEVRDFAKAVLGGVLGVPYSVDPSAKGVVSLSTPQPIARAEVFPAVEDALKAANLVMVWRGGVYTILPMDAARAQSPMVAAEQPGFGTEVVTLKYANPDEIRKLLDPIVPGVIIASDPSARTLTLSGASGQRRAVRDLTAQFDVDWMRDKSFGLFVPKHTDARLIAPELDRLINAPGSTTAGLVRLLPMERLNGIIAIASRPDYLQNVGRWVEVLDREGQSSERRLYVYRVQNGRASDLAQVLVQAFGGVSEGTSSGKGGNRTSSQSGRGQGQEPNLGQAADGGGSIGDASGSSGSSRSLPGQSPSAVSRGGGEQGLVVTADDTNNAVVAYATPREYALIEDALSKLDVTPLQVLIEAAITEVTLNDTLRYGTQWYLRSHGNELALSDGTTARPIQHFPGAAYTVISGGAIGATLSALSTVTHVRVLSAPNLMVLNNQTASLQVGDQVPIATGSSVSTTSPNAPVVNSIDYRDTGVILRVTPRVNSSGLVLLDIFQEVSQVSSSAANPIASPVIQERKIASSIAVMDGQTIALGGLISDSDTKGRSGVPLLSAVPVVGALFGDRDGGRKRTELLVLLSPRVVRSPEQALAATEKLRSEIRSFTAKPPKVEP